jgi:hypothetical protein
MESPFDDRSAWIDLYQRAAWRAHDSKVGQRLEHLERGEFLASFRFLGKRWGWGKDRVRAFLEFLQAAGFVARRRVVHSGSVYVIVNYDDSADADQANPAHITTESRQTPDSRQTAPRQSRSREAVKQGNNEAVATAEALRLTEVCNQAMQANPALSEARLLVAAAQNAVVRVWLDEGLDLEMAAVTIGEKCRSFRPKLPGGQPNGLNYFTQAIRERQRREQDRKANEAAAAEIAEAQRKQREAARHTSYRAPSDGLPPDKVPSMADLLREFAPTLVPNACKLPEERQQTAAEKAAAFRQAAEAERRKAGEPLFPPRAASYSAAATNGKSSGDGVTKCA